jgi:hypothetical protein
LIPSIQTLSVSTTCMGMFGNGVSILGIQITTAHRRTIEFGMPRMIPDLNPGSFVALRGTTSLAIVALPIVTPTVRRFRTTTSVSVLSISPREDRPRPDPPSPLGKGEHEWEVE